MNFQKRKLTELRVYSNNPRDNVTAVDKVRKSIESYGYVVPIIVDPNNIIVAGHTRFAALLQINEETGDYADIDVMVMDNVTPEAIKEFRIVDNQVAALSKWDFTALRIELETLPDFNLDDFGIIEGFDVDLVIPDDTPADVDNVATGMVKIAIGEYKLEIAETEYHSWATWVIGHSGLDVLEYVKRQLHLDPNTRDNSINDQEI